MTQHDPTTQFSDALATINRCDDHRRTVVSVHGELDLANVALLRRSLDRPGRHLEIDLSEAGFLDGAVIRVLTEAAEARSRTGGSFRIGQLRRFHASLLDQLGLADVLGITSDVVVRETTA